MVRYIGVDLGGTNLRAGAVDPATGEVLALLSVPTLAREGPGPVMERMAGLIRSVAAACGLSMAEVGGIGIGVPGRLDLEHGVVLFLPNLPGTWPDVPLAAVISQAIGRPVHLLNDVRAITYGEWLAGAGRGVETMACFAVGTGIGGGLVVNGQLHLGIGGTAGELGHQTIDPNGPLCGCGNRGCLEAFASGPAIAAMGVKAVSQGLTTSIGGLADYDLNRITPELICEAARGGDAIARDIWRQAGAYLGVAIANVLVMVGPRRVVIAGGVAAAGDLLFAPVRSTVQERVKMMPVDQVEIVPAALGANAGIIGAALWAARRPAWPAPTA
jgi:glucokinase